MSRDAGERSGQHPGQHPGQHADALAEVLASAAYWRREMRAPDEGQVQHARAMRRWHLKRALRVRRAARFRVPPELDVRGGW
jgi:hypothetical protein